MKDSRKTNTRIRSIKRKRNSSRSFFFLKTKRNTWRTKIIMDKSGVEENDYEIKRGYNKKYKRKIKF